MDTAHTSSLPADDEAGPLLAERLQQAVAGQLRCSGKAKVLLALSGGLDSMVLLDVLHQLQPVLNMTLRAVHVAHGLQTAAEAWPAFCEAQCAMREIALQVIQVRLAEPERNIEEQARQLRYQAFADLLEPDTALLTAHHADDQLETLLLALKRGSGLDGLAGIAAQRDFAGTLLCRPLLSFSRAELEAYAHWRQLAYVTDPSNQDLSFDRNFLRQQIIPQLTARFGSFSRTAARSCAHLQQSLQFQREQLVPLLAASVRDGRLQLAALGQHPAGLRDLLLREFLRPVPLVPTSEQLHQFSQQFLQATADAQPQLQWGDWQLRRFAGELYLLDAAEQRQLQCQPSRVYLPFNRHVRHAELGWQLFWSADAVPPAANWQSLPLSIAGSEDIWLDFGRLNRRFKPAGSQHSKALKDWCKQWKVPPWRRGILPFTIAGQPNQEQVLAVLGYASDISAAAAKSWLHWQSQAN